MVATLAVGVVFIDSCSQFPSESEFLRVVIVINLLKLVTDFCLTSICEILPKSVKH